MDIRLIPQHSTTTDNSIRHLMTFLCACEWSIPKICILRISVVVHVIYQSSFWPTSAGHYTNRFSCTFPRPLPHTNTLHEKILMHINIWEFFHDKTQKPLRHQRNVFVLKVPPYIILRSICSWFCFFSFVFSVIII